MPSNVSGFVLLIDATIRLARCCADLEPAVMFWIIWVAVYINFVVIDRLDGDVAI